MLFYVSWYASSSVGMGVELRRDARRPQGLCSQTRVLQPLCKGLPKGFSSQPAWGRVDKLCTQKTRLGGRVIWKESTQTGIRTQDQFDTMRLQ